MKAFTISALALLTTIVSATPLPEGPAFTARQITITFIGAADGRFTQNFDIKAFGSDIHDPLSVSKISNPGGAICYFYGVEGSYTRVPSGQTVDVGPPQPLRYGYCSTE